MSGFDVFLILIIAGFAFYGFFNGLIRTVGAIIALIAGVWLANLFYIPLYVIAEKLFFGFESLGRSVIFIILFVIINRLVNFLFILIEASYNSFFFIPFLKTLNRLLGALFGLVLGALILSLALYGLGMISFMAPAIARYGAGSKIMPELLKYAAVIIPFLPNLWEKINEFRNAKSLDLKGLKLDSLNADNASGSLKSAGDYLKEKVWNTSK